MILWENITLTIGLALHCSSAGLEKSALEGGRSKEAEVSGFRSSNPDPATFQLCLGLANITEPQFPHLQHGHNRKLYLIGLRGDWGDRASPAQAWCSPYPGARETFVFLLLIYFAEHNCSSSWNHVAKEREQGQKIFFRKTSTFFSLWLGMQTSTTLR